MHSESQDMLLAPMARSPEEEDGGGALTQPSGVKRRGFGSMTAERRREIASKGGKAAHQLGRAHKFTSEEAQAAGRKGGSIVGEDKEHMARIGSAGGNSRWRKQKAAQAEERRQAS